MIELTAPLGHRLPFIAQTEAAECGLTCLAMVAGYYGCDLDLLTLRRHYPISLKGATLAQLMELSERMDMSARALRLELENLGKLKCPAVLHWDLSHFVVLKTVRGRKAVLHDPARGVVTLSLAEVSKHFTGVALELTPVPGFVKRTEREHLSLRTLWGQQRGLKRFLAQIFLFSIALEVFAVLTPLFMQIVVDRVLVADDWSLLTTLGLGFGILAVITAVVTAFRAWVILYLSTHLNYSMLTRLFRHLLKLPLSFFIKRHIGDIMSRFGSLQIIQQTLTTQFVASVVDGIMVAGTLVIMFIYSATLSAVAIGMVVSYMFMRYLLYRPLYTATQNHIMNLARQESNFLETVRGMQTIRLFGAEPMRRAAWKNMLARTLNAQAGVGKVNIGSTFSNGLVLGLGNVGIVWLGAVSIMRGNLSIGMLFAFFAFSTQFSTKAMNLVENGIQLRMLTFHSERVADIALSEPEQARDSALLGVRQLSGALTIKDLGCRYGAGEQAVFSNISFGVRAGECVAITGPSGVGKSTLIKLLLGLMKPTTGQVLADGFDIEKFGVDDYRKQVAAVLQDDQLFTGSIADNISFFELNPDVDHIELCAKLSAIHEEILAMPMGYRSLIGDMGSVLSSGQKQRVLLARALYRRPKILFLDEATSHLDLDRESIINIAIRRLRITRVIVAHRLETLDYADRILTLTSNGVISDS